jgi:8-oxo-dGTP diphosphatase
MSDKRDKVIRAAGGLVWRGSGDSREIALVHRAQYDDWSLPKGKVEDGETWVAAALREVEEETGCSVSLDEFAGCSCYSVKGIAKVVLFWHMILDSETVFEPNKETDELIWLSAVEATRRLDYDTERALLTEHSKLD